MLEKLIGKCGFHGNDGEGRKVPPQPNVFATGGGCDGSKAAARYNLRRFSELPFHLVGAERTEELFREVSGIARLGEPVNLSIPVIFGQCDR